MSKPTTADIKQIIKDKDKAVKSGKIVRK